MLETGGAVLLHGAGKATVDAVAAEVDRLLTALGERSDRIEAVRQQQERISAKGLSFENLLGPVLDACFSPHADVCEATGATKGIAEEKIGDFVVTLNQRDTGGRERRIVFEAKDQRLSMNSALGELDKAILNRDANVGFMVFARPEQAPLTGKPLRAFPGNRIIAVFDKEDPGETGLALEVGCQLARSMAIAAEHEDLGLDRAMLADRLAKVVSAVDRANTIRRGIRSARKNLDTAESAYDEMREEALALLSELQDRL